MDILVPGSAVMRYAGTDSEDPQAIGEALREKEWHRFVYLHERPWRPFALWYIVEQIVDNQRYWDLTRSIWIDSENIWQNREVWKRLLLTNRPGYFMSEKDRTQFKKLPEPVTVYRGYLAGKNFNGYSWTTNQEKAKWYAKRFANPKEEIYGGVRGATVSKNEIFAYTDEREDQEVIILRAPRKF